MNKQLKTVRTKDIEKFKYNYMTNCYNALRKFKRSNAQFANCRIPSVRRPKTTRPKKKGRQPKKPTKPTKSCNRKLWSAKVKLC